MKAADLVERFLKSVEDRDFDAYRAAFAPGARLRQNGVQRSVDEMVESTRREVQSVRYFDRRLIVAPDAVVEQHGVRAVMADGSEIVAPDICIVFRLDEQGRITELDEYIPAPVDQ